MIDLHIHSCYSDGNRNIRDIITECKSKNIDIISFTDHNTIKSLDEIKKEYGNDKTITIIKGVEFYPYKEKTNKFHLLAYDYDINKNFISLLNCLDKKRLESMKEKILFIKQNFNIDIDVDNLSQIWLSNYTLKMYLTNIYNELFAKNVMNLIKQNNFKIDKKVEYKYLLNIILNANGIPVLAHPKSVICDNFDEFLHDLVNNGLMGIEAYHSSHTPEDVEKYLNYAKKYNLLVSCGSDYHGLNNKDYLGRNVELGCYYKNDSLNDVSILEYIRRREHV